MTEPVSNALGPVALAAEIASAYVANNRLGAAELPALIQSVHAALLKLGQPESAALDATKPEPKVSARKSITPDHLICLDDGLKFKSLKRHLGALGMTPDQYRAKWGLPADYPMVAPNYASQRSALAKSMGLGQARKKTSAGTKG